MDKNTIWDQPAGKKRQFPVLKEDFDADVVIIGGGITGLLTAYLLEKSGNRVVLLEADTIGDGTTAYSSCHLTTDIDFEYRNVSASFNEETAKLVADSRVAGINLIEKIAKAHNIVCGFKRVDGYLYTENKEDVTSIKEEASYASKAGLDVSLTAKVPLPFETLQGLVFHQQAEFNALQFIIGLADVLSKTSCKIFENSRVTGLVEKDGFCGVQTERGSIHAKHVVVAAHLPAFSHVLQTMAAPYRSYMMAVTLKEEHYPKGLFWDTADPYHYTRTYTHDAGQWLVVGGADHKTGVVETTEQSYEALEKYVRERYAVNEITHRWSAQFYEPVDGLPYIGRNPFSKNIFIATGFSGDGLVYGATASMIISDLIMEKANKWSGIFDPTRFNPLASAKEFIKENSDVLKHFVKDRFVAEDLDLKDVKIGEGKIIEKDGEKLAVARDSNNEVYVLSPVCTHLKCFVKWNSSEKSWDCPCHGSRFSINGEVITGPAIDPLENLGVEKNIKI